MLVGNETADRLAKAAAKLPQPHLSTSYKEVKTLLKQIKQKPVWIPRNNGYDPQKDQTIALYRRTQTTIFRLHTGHCGLRKHLKRLGLADLCPCACGFDKQTVEHILQTCPHLETVHQQFWPEDTEVGTKLWGQAAELQQTADLLAATGLRISTVITSNVEEEEECLPFYCGVVSPSFPQSSTPSGRMKDQGQ